MGTYGTFGTDAKVEQEGVWVDYGDAGKFRVARAGGSNRKFTRLTQKLLKPYRRAIQTDTMDPTVLADIVRRVYAETVILGWENVTGPDGEPLEYSIINCEKLMKDLDDLYQDIVAQANQLALYRAEIQQVDAGN